MNIKNFINNLFEQNYNFSIINNKDDKIKVNIHNCIVCGVCIEKCPVKAIKYTNKNQNEK